MNVGLVLLLRAKLSLGRGCSPANLQSCFCSSGGAVTALWVGPVFPCSRWSAAVQDQYGIRRGRAKVELPFDENAVSTTYASSFSTPPPIPLIRDQRFLVALYLDAFVGLNLTNRPHY